MVKAELEKPEETDEEVIEDSEENSLKRGISIPDLEEVVRTDNQKTIPLVAENEKLKEKYEKLCQTWHQLGDQIGEIRKKVNANNEEIESSFCLVQETIDQWLIDTAEKLIKKNEVYQFIKGVEFEEKIIKLYEKNSGTASPLESGLKGLKEEAEERMKRRETAEKNKAEQTQEIYDRLNMPMQAGFVITRFITDSKEEKSVLYLPVSFENRDMGLMGSLTKTMLKATKDFLSDIPTNHQGITKIVIDCDYDTLLERLEEQEPKYFEEANVEYCVIDVMNIKPEEKKKTGILNILRRRKYTSNSD